MAIRKYGPGKFSKLIDSYAFDVTLDGGADEEESFGDMWYGLLMLDKGAREAIRQAAGHAEDELTQDEEDLIDDSVAVIFFERSDGIVEASWFYDEKEALSEWAGIQEDCEDEEESE